MIPSLSRSSVASAARRGCASRGAIAGLLAAALPMLPFTAAAMGLGEIAQQSSLGQSLRIVVPVTVGPDEDVPAECFKLIGSEREGDGVPQLLFGRVNVERTPAGTRLVVTNGRPVNDPIVRITVQAGCESAVRREYMVFLDPPAIEAPVVAAESVPPEPVVAAQPAPVPREARRSTRAQARAPANAPTRSATATAPASGTEPQRKAAPKGRSVAKAPPSRSPAGASERPRFSVSSGAPLTGSSATEADRERARQERANAIEAETQVLRQRIVELTAMVERMQQELRAQEAAEKAAAEQAAADTGKSGARATEAPAAPAAAATPPDAAKAEAPAAAKSEPASGAKAPPAAPVNSWWDDNAPLLAVILGLGLLTTAGLLWKRRRDAAQDERWRTAEAAPIRAGPRTESPTSVLRNPSAGIALSHPETIAPLASEVDMTSTRDAADALAVSELSHVTEEARVFMALGHNDRAIEVLHDHIRRLPRATPAAWLMLLDLYHATGKLPEFRKLADDFHAQFNVQSPSWEAFAGNRSESSGLEGFPHVEQQVVELWRKPGCRNYLERLLHDNREGRRTGFPLSTYADILLLLQVLDAPAEVDIDGDLAAAGKFDRKPPATRAAAPTPARARRPMPPEPSVSRPTQQPIRFEIEPPDVGSPKKS